MRIVNRRRTDNTMDKRYQRGNENPLNLRRTDNTMDKDTKAVMRIRKSKKNRQHNDQKIPNG